MTTAYSNVPLLIRAVQFPMMYLSMLLHCPTSIFPMRILRIILSLNPNKAHGWDDISVRMTKTSYEALVAPFRFMFENCEKKAFFHKFGNKLMLYQFTKKQQIIEEKLSLNYRYPYSQCAQLIKSCTYKHLSVHTLLNPSQSSFCR